MMDVTKMPTKLLWAEKEALQDIAQDGQMTAADRAYYQAIVAEINLRIIEKR